MLKNKECNRLFAEKGFVTIPFTSPENINRLAELYRASFHPKEVALNVSHNQSPGTKNLEVSRSIKRLLITDLQVHFEKYQFVLAHFICKSAGTDQFDLHQDWSIVDENKYLSAQIWIPLSDTDPSNGSLFFIEGSHTIYPNKRSGSLDIPRISTDRLESHITSTSVKKGEALIFHPAVYHGSYANTSDADRLNVLINICDDQAALHYYHQSKLAKFLKFIEVFEIDPKTILNQLSELEKGKRPRGRSLFRREKYKLKHNSDINDGFMLNLLSKQ